MRLFLGMLLITIDQPLANQQEVSTTEMPWRDDSCLYRCVEAYFPGRTCYCNEACDQYENCCVDYYPTCRPDFVWTNEWLHLAGHQYKYFADPQSTAESSRIDCRKYGGLLVAMHDQVEADFVALKVLKKRTLSAFMGGRDEGGDWMWPDGSLMPLPTEAWHLWYDGQPDNTDGTQGCSVFTNYMFWVSPMFMIDRYTWRSFGCDINGNIIQGYVCERTLQCEPNPCQNNGTCMYVGGDREYHCQCQEGYVGNHCEYELIKDAIWTECGVTSLTAKRDVTTLTSPLFPQTYPPNVRCEWHITTDRGKNIKLSVEMLDIEKGKECVFDYLTVHDGSRENGSIMLGPVCGDLDNHNDLGSSFISANIEVVVEFHTDHSHELGGFVISFAEEVCGQGTGSSGCGTPGLFTSQCGSVELAMGPERPDDPCQISIVVPDGQIVNINFTEFDIFDSGKACPDGGLLVHDGPSATPENMIGSYCGFRFPWAIHSQTNYVTLKLFGITLKNNFRIKLDYDTIDPTQWSQLTSDSRHIIRLSTGTARTINTTGYDANMRYNGRETQILSIQGDHGHRIMINILSWSLNDYDNILIYDGFDSNSRLLADLSHVRVDNQSSSYHLVSTSFRVCIVVERTAGDPTGVQLTTGLVDYAPELSGCYRPYYSDKSHERYTALENHLVTSLKPVVLMVSEQSVGVSDPGYDQGLYCTWTVHGEPGKALSLTFLDFNIPPLSDQCDYDGVVVYDNNGMHGPFCGSSPVEKLTASESKVKVVFYSDSAYHKRRSGILRVLIETSDSCPVRRLETTRQLHYKSDCGTVLSPNFPGKVAPGLWTWTVEGLQNAQYFAIYVHYVRGPGVKDDCQQTFKLNEVPHDTSKLQHKEISLLTLCGSTDLFVPKKRYRLPPYQKLGIELDTMSNSVPNRWEFKLSYARETMVPPVLTSDTYACPSDYTHWRGSCYKYFPWVYRHYQDQYSWQQTWQQSLAHCDTVENATLISIHDEDEAYFIKYMLTTDWFWNMAGTIQANGRLVFIGLHNKYGRYEWTDGSQLSYADWYVPPKAWEQATIMHDSIGTDFLGLSNPQPTADVGSLCSALLVTSPFASLSWTKVPCDYPIFRSGLICEKPATRVADDDANQEMSLRNTNIATNQTIQAICPEGWSMIQETCLRLLTNYEAVRNPLVADPWTYSRSHLMCQAINGVMASINNDMLAKLNKYLLLWRHDVVTGHIWVNRTDSGMNIITVLKDNPLNEVTYYQLAMFEDGDTPETYPRNVLCQTASIVHKEYCRDQEFQCGDESCINRDSICDGMFDCPDMDDEMNCECSEETFQCRDGQCIPISLYCDFQPHCQDGSDEYNCVIEACDPSEFTCRSGQCIPEPSMCDFIGDCNDGSDEESIICEGICRGVPCFSGACIPSSLRKDLISDCPGLAAEDEIQRSTLTVFEIYQGGLAYDNDTSYVGCDDSETHVQCREGQPRCYPRSSTCIYDTMRVDDGTGLEIQATCRDGAHLRNLCGDMECPGMFHCPVSYCIPHRKVCDGLKDCPDGEDELNCHNQTCPGLFRCKGEQFCISHMEVCDGTVHCLKHGDDEKYCFGKTDSSEITDLCASGCSCTGFIIDCTGTGQNTTLNLTANAKHTKALLLSQNQFRLDSWSFTHLFSLGRLILSYNRLTRLPLEIFNHQHNLYNLDLSNNMIEALQPAVFDGLVSLRKLNLDHNALLDLQQETLVPLVQLNHLIITNNILSKVKQNIFEGSPALRELNSDAPKFCCIAPQTEICTPEPDEFSSCEDLMANYALQVSIWVLGVIACVGNFFVIIWRMRQKNILISSFFIINLGVSDFLMGVYMMIIASVDAYYRGVYIVYADAWRSSALCQFSGILAMLSSELSVFMLTAITADRWMNIMFPLKMGTYRMKHARIVVMAGWMACLFMSILPATGIQYFGDAFFGRSGVCLPFQVTNEKLPGWEYSVFIFLVLNLASFVLIFAGYAFIFLKVKRSIQNMKDKSTSTTDEYALAKKLAVIVATDFICWVPIILIGFAALGGAKISPQVSAWIAVFILPLNSAVNPLLYTISALDCGKKKPSVISGLTASKSVMRTIATHVPGSRIGTNAANGSTKKNNEPDVEK